MSTGVLIVDDSHFMRNLLRQILEQDHRILGEASNGAEAVKLYKEHEPDIVMMDIVMPKCNGIKRRRPSRKSTRAHVSLCARVSDSARK